MDHLWWNEQRQWVFQPPKSHYGITEVRPTLGLEAADPDPRMNTHNKLVST